MESADMDLDSRRCVTTVAEALPEMTKAVRSGDMQLARTIGDGCIVPLSLTSADIKLHGKLSDGAEGSVHRGTWQGRDVAVKKVRISTSADLERFKRELNLLAAFHHPAVVPLLGARALPPDYWLVLPLAVGGNLRHALYGEGWRPSWRQLLAIAYTIACGMEHVHAAEVLHRDLKPANLLLPEPLRQPPPAAAQAAVARPSLDSGRQGGGDVKMQTAELAGEQQQQSPHTPLLGRTGPGSGGVGTPAAASWLSELVRVQIADFGIAVPVESSRVEGEGDGNEGDSSEASSGSSQRRTARSSIRKPTGGFHKQQMVGTLEYMAPELLLRTAPASFASDVYAWAVTVNELATGVVPFSDCTKDNPDVHTVLEMGYGRMELAAAVCSEGLRPLLPRVCPPGFAALIQQCWAGKPEQRPTFAQIRLAIERLAEDDLPAWERQQEQQRNLASGGMRVSSCADVIMEPWESSKGGSTDPGAAVAGSDGMAKAVEGGLTQQVVVTVEVDSADDTPLGASVHNISGDAKVASTAPFAAAHASAGNAAAAAGLLIQPPFVLCPEGASHGTNSSPASNNDRLAASAQPCNGAGSNRAACTRVTFNAGMFEAIGPRDTMEDRNVILANVLEADHGQSLTVNRHIHLHHQHAEHGPSGEAQPAVAGAIAQAAVPVAAVFDGHRGAEAAELCRVRLPDVLRAAIRECGSPADALRRTFLQLEQEYHVRWVQRHTAHSVAATVLRTPFPGTTALVALVDPSSRTLYIANAGDCRAVLCRARRALAGSRDHTGLLPDERERLRAAGVQVTWQHGGWRIGPSGLQVTRCIGDFDVKAGAGAGTGAGAGHSTQVLGSAFHAGGPGVTALPEVTAVQLCADDHFLILASDGLWDVMSVQEATGLVYDTVKDPTLAAKRLVTEALMRGSADNVTAVVAFLSDTSTIERVYTSKDGESYAVTGTAYGSRVRMAKDRHVTAAADEMRETY